VFSCLVSTTVHDMKSHAVDAEVLGPWSLAVSREFWEGFGPNALAGQRPGDELSAVFLADSDWSRVRARVSQHDGTAHIVVSGDGDLDAAAAQVGRFLALDVDARGWPAVAERDPVIADAQRRLPGLRPCGFYSPYEAAAWSVLSQRIRIAQAAKLRSDLIDQHGDEGAFPAPQRLRGLDLDLPGRKAEYLYAVAEAALDGQLDAADLRSSDPERALALVQEIKGVGPFAAELIVLRGANAPDVAPRNERRLNAEISERYGPGRSFEEIAAAWRPYRTWAAFHLRATAGGH
jgi:DNA-3-methyladenine glycosylase II